MSAAPNIQRIEDKLRDRANIAEGFVWVLGIFSVPVLLELAYVGLVWLSALWTYEGVLGVLGYLLLIAPAALGIGQLRFYRRRGRGERTRCPYSWWGSATVLNGSLALLLGSIALGLPPWVLFHEMLSGIATTLPDDLHYWYVDNYGLGFENFGFVAVAGVTYNSFAGLFEEHDLAEHRRWRDIVGPDVHAPIA